MKSRQITLRNVSPNLHRKLLNRAKDNGTSMNDVVLKLLETQLGLGQKSAPKRNIKWFVGSNGLEKRVRDELQTLRTVDGDLWK